jgi:hypothetical protein
MGLPQTWRGFKDLWVCPKSGEMGFRQTMRLQETKLVDHVQDIKNGLLKISTEPISYPSRERERERGMMVTQVGGENCSGTQLARNCQALIMSALMNEANTCGKRKKQLSPVLCISSPLKYDFTDQATSCCNRGARGSSTYSSSNMADHLYSLLIL